MKQIFLFIAVFGSVAFSQSSNESLAGVKKCHDHILQVVVGAGFADGTFGYVAKDFSLILTSDKYKFSISNGQTHYACTLTEKLDNKLKFTINQNLPGFGKYYEVVNDQGRKTTSLFTSTYKANLPAATCIDTKKYNEVEEAKYKWLTPEKAEQLYIEHTKLLIEDLYKSYDDRKVELHANWDYKQKQFSHLMKERSDENNRLFSITLNLCAIDPRIATFVEESKQKNNFVSIEMIQNSKNYKFEAKETRLPPWRKSAPTKGQDANSTALPAAHKQ